MTTRFSLNNQQSQIEFGASTTKQNHVPNGELSNTYASITNSQQLTRIAQYQRWNSTPMNSSLLRQPRFSSLNSIASDESRKKREIFASSEQIGREGGMGIDGLPSLCALISSLKRRKFQFYVVHEASG